MAPTLAAVLDAAIRATGCPIDGVSIGRVGDRATWTPIFTKDATPAQQAQVASLIASIDIQAAQTTKQDQDRQIEVETDGKLLAVAQAVYEAIPAPKVTLDELTARIAELYKSAG